MARKPQKRKRTPPIAAVVEQMTPVETKPAKKMTAKLTVENFTKGPGKTTRTLPPSTDQESVSVPRIVVDHWRTCGKCGASERDCTVPTPIVRTSELSEGGTCRICYMFCKACGFTWEAKRPN